MARELRALLLWGRRLRAPVLAAFPGGEGGRGRGRAGPSEASSPFLFRGRRGGLCEIGAPSARRAAPRSAQGDLVSPGSAPRRTVQVPLQVTRLRPGPRDSSRSFCRAPQAWARRGRALLSAGALRRQFRGVNSEGACSLGTDFTRVLL